MQAVQRTCQDKGDESKERVDEPEDDACEDTVSNERLDLLHARRLGMRGTNEYHLFRTFPIFL